jgi:hypothetical protein
MNRLGSQQRKFVYLGGILLLLIPVITLGMPADGTPGSGGTVAKMRQELDLGESGLGDLDPSGSAMNLVLLGLRGVAANILWMQADQQKSHKDWEQMRATTEQIIRLQPHYAKVWEYNGWNLAYNVSAEWDAVPDRYFWVKEGGKFLQKGVARNRRSPDLHWHVGRIYGPKIGLADEAKYYRRYFRQDPDPKFNNGTDPEWNDRDEDNYLVAKEWFAKANDIEGQGKVRQTIMERAIFRSYPARSQLDYAAALQKFGYNEAMERLPAGEREAAQDQIRNQLREQTREAWEIGFSDWTKKYGQELFTIDFLGQLMQIRLEMTEEEIKDLAKTDELIGKYKAGVMQYQNMTNYRYWRTRGLCEAEPDTAEAHWQLFAATEAARKQEAEKTIAYAFQSMQLFDKVMQRYPELGTEDNFMEEAVTAVLAWRLGLQFRSEKPPEDYPLKGLFETQSPEQMAEHQRRFDRLFQ